MKTLFRLLAATPLLAAAAHAAEFLDYPAALAEAKATGKEIVLFEDGSDWIGCSRELNARLADPALRQRLGDRVIWARHDNPDSLPPNFKEDVKPDTAPWNLPALLVIGPDGRTNAAAEGIRPERLPALISAVPKIIEQRIRRDLAWKKAEKATGVERARLYGTGLDLLPFELAKMRRDIRDEIKKADPQDLSGYGFKYELDQSGTCAFHEGVTMKLIGEKKYPELIAEVNKRLGNPALTPNQRQIIMAGRFQAYKAAGDMPKALAELKTIAALSPTTDMGRAAISYLKAHTEPVRLDTPAWRGDHNPPTWVPFVLDVSKIVTAPGTYEVEFRHKGGHTRFKKISFVSGKTELAVDENTSESRKVRLKVATPPPSVAKPATVELRAEAQGTGWYDGHGEILVTKVD